MSEIYEPGTVAVATVRGVEGVRVMWTGNTSTGKWVAERLVTDRPSRGITSYWADSAGITDIRPLVVLDLDGIAPEAIVKALRDKDAGTNSTGWARVADQIEAQTKPPRIPEPGPGGVVDAGCVHSRTVKRWVRIGSNWYIIDEDANPDDWDSLIDPVLIREGP